MRQSFEIRGTRELKRTLNNLADQVSRRAIRGALTAGAKPIRKSARANVRVRTKELRKNIKTRSAKFGTGSVVVLVGPTGLPKSRAHFEEFGTIKEAAHPFMRPAWDSQKEIALRIITREMETRVLKIAKKIK